MGDARESLLFTRETHTMATDVPENDALSNVTNSTQTTLFTPLRLRSVALRNRIVVSPMCQYSCEAGDGKATDWHLVHLGGLAVGGASLVFTEATAVEERGRISTQDLGIWNDEQIASLVPITRFIRARGAVPGMQLAHAGRKASVRRPWDGGGPLSAEAGAWEPVAPSAMSFAERYTVPHALSPAEIGEVIAHFADATRRALEAGFEVIELHAAHGYLLHQFLSPVSNTRKDRYGGSFENRIRIVVESVRALRRVWPEQFPLFVRVSATDWLEGRSGVASWTVEQTVALAHVLRDEGVDVIDCSSGGNIARARIPDGPGYQTRFAERIRREASIATMALGRITSPEQADTILRSGQADLVALAREELRNPHWPLHAGRILGYEAPWPPQYERAR